MQFETKFLKLRTPVTVGSLFGDWRVSWCGGWTKHRRYYLVGGAGCQTILSRMLVSGLIGATSG